MRREHATKVAESENPDSVHFPVGLTEIRAAQRLLSGSAGDLSGRPIAIRTPLVFSEPLSHQLGCRVWLKLENLQRTGSYKVRGAFNNIANLSPETRQRGLITASAGNHAQGVAAAAAAFGIADKTTIFVPVGTPKVKQDNTRGFGVEVREIGDTFDQAREAAYAEATHSERAFIEPFDDWHTIAGQGTIGLEIADELPGCRAVFAPVGGGGLISGIALAMHALAPETMIVGAQAAGSAAMQLSLERGMPTSLPTPPTTQIADGIKVRQPGNRPFTVVQALLGRDAIVAVPDIETIAAAADLMVYAKLIAEGAGAISLAALREIQLGRASAYQPFGPADDVVVIVSGGNIDPSFSWRILYEQTVPNLITLRVAMPDRPGELLRMLLPIARQNVNIIDVDVNRLDSRPRIGERIVEVCVAVAHQAQADHLIGSLNESGYRVLVSRWHDPKSESTGFTVPSSYSEVRNTIERSNRPPVEPSSPAPSANARVDIRIELLRLTDAHGKVRPENTFLPGEPIYVELEIRSAGQLAGPAGIRTGVFSNASNDETPLNHDAPDLVIRHGPFTPRRSPYIYGSWPEGPKSERFAKLQSFFTQHEPGTYRALALVDIDGLLGQPASRRMANVNYVIAQELPVDLDSTYEDDLGTALLVVNKKRPLPRDYIPSELRQPNVSQDTTHEVRPEVATAVEGMFAAALQANIRLRLISGYRSWARQRTIFEEMVRSSGMARALSYVARPGFSEHQTGLAVDLGDSDHPHHDLQNSFADLSAGKWLSEHAADFGFHLRYPKDREPITGFAWESWHFRFVGKTLARALQSSDETLEEYFGVEGGRYVEKLTERGSIASD